jgi:hypothetical protein
MNFSFDYVLNKHTSILILLVLPKTLISPHVVKVSALFALSGNKAHPAAPLTGCKG